jgi:hypothetical protein
VVGCLGTRLHSERPRIGWTVICLTGIHTPSRVLQPFNRCHYVAFTSSWGMNTGFFGFIRKKVQRRESTTCSERSNTRGTHRAKTYTFSCTPTLQSLSLCCLHFVLARCVPRVLLRSLHVVDSMPVKHITVQPILGRSECSRSVEARSTDIG